MTYFSLFQLELISYEKIVTYTVAVGFKDGVNLGENSTKPSLTNVKNWNTVFFKADVYKFQIPVLERKQFKESLDRLNVWLI